MTVGKIHAVGADLRDGSCSASGQRQHAVHRLVHAIDQRCDHDQPRHGAAVRTASTAWGPGHVANRDARSGVSAPVIVGHGVNLGDRSEPVPAAHAVIDTVIIAMDRNLFTVAYLMVMVWRGQTSPVRNRSIAATGILPWGPDGDAVGRGSCTR